MDKYSKLRSTCHEPADVDSFYERGKSQNIDGDNEYTVNIVETKEHDEMNENEDITDLDDEYMRDPVTGNKILLPEGRRYHFSRRRSMSTSEIMDLELARTFDNVQAMIASYKKESDPEDFTPVSTPKMERRANEMRLDSPERPSTISIQKKLSKRRNRSPTGKPLLSPATSASMESPPSPHSPVVLRKKTTHSIIAESNVSNTSPGTKRSSVLVHENEDLLNLADEVHFREMFLSANRSKNSTPSSSNNNLSNVTGMNDAGSVKSSTTVRRNSSGYSTSSGGSTMSSVSNRDAIEARNNNNVKDGSKSSSSVIEKESKNESSDSTIDSNNRQNMSYVSDGKPPNSSITVSYTGSRKKDLTEIVVPQQKLKASAKRSVSPRNQPRYRTVPNGVEVPQDLKQAQQTFLKNRRASVCAANAVTNQQFIKDFKAAQEKQEKQSVGHRLSSIFSASHRGSPSAKKIERKIAMDRQKSQDHTQNERHNNFVQNRSKTGISFFSNRRRQSIAITDDAYNSALRAAKSHYDLSMGISEGSGKGSKDLKSEKKSKRESFFSPQTTPQISPVKVPSAIPFHLQPQIGAGTTSAASTPNLKKKGGLKDRSWTELERIWKGKVKDPPGPNIENMLKPHVSFACDRKGNDVRAFTLPIEPSDVMEAERSLGQHKSLTVSGSAPYDTQSNKHRLSSEKHLRSKTIKGYPPRQIMDMEATNANVSRSDSNTSSKSAHSDTLGKPSSIVVTAPSPKMHHRRTPSGSMISNWIASHTSETTKQSVLEHFHSPFVVRKAIDLLAPDTIHDWQTQKGYHRGISVPPDHHKHGMGKNERPEHFNLLLEHW